MLIYLILMPIIYVALLFPIHYENTYFYVDTWHSQISKEKKQKKEEKLIIIWSLIKLIVYYIIETIYCFFIYYNTKILPFQKNEWHTIKSYNTFFIIFSIIFIFVHLFIGYTSDFDGFEDYPPIMHIIILSILFAFYLCIGCWGFDNEKFEELPYQEIIETRTLHQLGDSLVSDVNIKSSRRYIDISFKDNYTISYSYIKNNELLIDNFTYNQNTTKIIESKDEHAYLEIIRYYKELENTSYYDEYFKYIIYLPKGSFSDGSIQLDLQ